MIYNVIETVTNDVDYESCACCYNASTLNEAEALMKVKYDNAIAEYPDKVMESAISSEYCYFMTDHNYCYSWHIQRSNPVKKWIVVQYGDYVHGNDDTTCVTKIYDTFDRAVKAARQLYEEIILYNGDSLDNVSDSDDCYSDFSVENRTCYGWYLNAYEESWHVVVKELII